ncbi:MAG: hypothetical protein MUF85_03800 [Patescibacteria group bacterium]|jgi:hypothetical protein|nr:hypothetical protein [Patescibacteria group bacterium]
MNKGSLHHYYIKYRYISLLIPIILITISGVVAIYSLRDNNLKMLKLKEAVVVADANGGDVEKALQDLRTHVNTHMNTKLRPDDSSEPPIQLVKRYEQIIALQQANSNVDSRIQKLLQDGQRQCANVGDSLRNQCIKDYFVANGGGNEYFKLPPKELYTFDFASPRWTPDRAGLSLVVFFVSVAALVARLIVGFIVKRQLK